MIQPRSLLALADNSGARTLRCIRVHGGRRKRYAQLGEIITASVFNAVPYASVKKGDVVHAVIVRQRKECRRADGSAVRFSDNAAVIVDPKSKEPKGTRIFGPIAREVKNRGFTKIASLAPEVV